MPGVCGLAAAGSARADGAGRILCENSREFGAGFECRRKSAVPWVNTLQSHSRHHLPIYQTPALRIGSFYQPESTARIEFIWDENQICIMSALLIQPAPAPAAVAPAVAPAAFEWDMFISHVQGETGTHVLALREAIVAARPSARPWIDLDEDSYR